MTTTRPLVLVVAQSARFLAQQAAREGYRVRAADQFNDVDLLRVCEKTLSIPDINSASIADIGQSILRLADNEPAVLLAGTGAEIFYPIFNQLPSQISLANNKSICFEQCHQPGKWFALLKKLQIPHPPTCFDRPESSSAPWLFKPATGWGGVGIQPLTSATDNQSGFYQHHVEGQPFSVLFFADRNGWQWLSTQSQHSLPDRFIHQQLRSHFKLTASSKTQIIAIINKLNRALPLRGFNSIDCILTQQEVVLLELNPRPAASMQLLDSTSLISAQIGTCRDDEAIRLQTTSSQQTLVYLFAPHSGHIRHAAYWPDNCHDLPAAGQFVRHGEIVCSALIPTTDTLEITRQRLSRQIMQNITQ